MKLKDLFESTGKSVADLDIDYKGGDFSCASNELTSLAGAPSHVGGNFSCRACTLKSLKGAPSHVGGSFYCNDNELASLAGTPSHVGGSFYCYDNELASLAGAPSHVGGAFYCYSNKLTSLKDVHKHVTEIKGIFYAVANPINSHALGLLLIKGVTEVRLDNKRVMEILNSYLGKGRAGMLMAQEELIEAGLEEFAKL